MSEPDNDAPPSRSLYTLIGIAVVALGVVALVVPGTPVGVACWLLLLPLVVGYTLLVRWFQVPMGPGPFVAAYNCALGLFWLLLGALQLGVAPDYDQLLRLINVLFLVMVVVQALHEWRTRRGGGRPGR